MLLYIHSLYPLFGMQREAADENDYGRVMTVLLIPQLRLFPGAAFNILTGLCVHNLAVD